MTISANQEGVHVDNHSSIPFPMSVAALEAWAHALPRDAAITAVFKETGSQRDPITEGKALHAHWTTTL